jgi:hypothetical protein
LAIEEGITPAYIAVGAAAGLCRYLKENGVEQSVDTAKAVLLEVSNLEETHTLAKLILHYYEMMLSGGDLAKLIDEADKIKHENMSAVV